jgi:hypothetical protein
VPVPELNIPEYEYRPETMSVQLKRLLLQFLRANSKDRGAVAKALKCSLDLLNRWIEGQITTGLLSTSLQKFVEVTGIQLDRMMVIQAKLEILERLKRVAALRTEDPSYAFLLDLDPDLDDKISFDNLLTRAEIAGKLKLVYEEIGGPLLGAQLFQEERNMVGWWDEKGGRLPSGSSLEKAIIRLVTGFVRDDPTIRSRDDTRFRVMAHLLLGCEPQDVLGVRTLPEALGLLMTGMSKWTTSALSCEIGIPEHSLGALRKWTPATGSGKMSPITIVMIIKSLLKKSGRGAKVEALEQAFAAYSQKNSKGWPGEPVFWPREEGWAAAVVFERREDAPAPAPTPEPAPESAPTGSADMLDRLSDVSILVRLEFSRAISTLQVLTTMFPQLKDLLPQSFTQVGETRMGEAVAPDKFSDLGNGSGAMSAEELKLLVTTFGALPVVMRRLLKSSDDVRNRTLRGIDSALVEMHDLLDAARSTEPEKYLSQVIAPRRQAKALVGK